ncbi:hypothetical protein [Vagococcus salmoninarum]|uniref:hypothetical protein n=1 Tax=Vagococcus salmoninarum TaxID=2739 RepID=UPI001881E9FC|nr:hypothetical protein [Vagococcus salmoninarum]MBE9389949.1 hypothetical protein [Vagococcus salmoninarum]
MKRTINLIGNASLNIINNTVIVFPFMVFLKLGSSHTVTSILPFVIFYTFRMTGVFFIRGIKTRLNSFTLLKLSIYIGVLGSISGVSGFFIPELEFIAALLLGLSAAWLPMSNTSINYYKKENDLISPKSSRFNLFILLLISSTLLFPNNYSYASFFVLYAIMYCFALSTLKNIKKYKVNSHDLEDYSYRYLVLFIVFFILLFYLRSSRLLYNTLQFDYFVYGVLFFIFSIFVIEIFKRNKIQRRISNNLSYLTMLNGAVGNYLFLFSSLYTAGYYGHNSLFTKFYFPYVLGIALAPIITDLLQIEIRKKSLIGITLGLMIILLTPFFSIGILTLSIFKGVLNTHLAETYLCHNNLPLDKRLWVKYTMQSMGSIMHQFILMLIGSFIVLENQTSIKNFLIITSQKHPTLVSKSLMTNWNFIATGILIIAIISYKIIFKEEQKNPF